MFIVKHKSSNITLGKFKYKLDAKALIKRIEACDKENDEYEPNTYIIEEE